MKPFHIHGSFVWLQAQKPRNSAQCLSVNFLPTIQKCLWLSIGIWKESCDMRDSCQDDFRETEEPRTKNTDSVHKIHHSAIKEIPIQDDSRSIRFLWPNWAIEILRQPFSIIFLIPTNIVWLRASYLQLNTQENNPRRGREFSVRTWNHFYIY